MESRKAQVYPLSTQSCLLPEGFSSQEWQGALAVNEVRVETTVVFEDYEFSEVGDNKWLSVRLKVEQGENADAPQILEMIERVLEAARKKYLNG